MPERYVLFGYWIDGYAEFEDAAPDDDTCYVLDDYWEDDYAECPAPLPASAYTRGFGGWNYTEEELRAFAEADRRRRIVRQIQDLERQLAIETAWAEQMEPVAAQPPPAVMGGSPPNLAGGIPRRLARNMVSPRNIEARLGSSIERMEEDEITSLLLLGA